VGNNFSLHKKFMRLMDQVSDDREKELDIINQIEAIEERHHNLKKLNLLRRADLGAERKRKQLLKKKDSEAYTPEEDEEESPHRTSWAEILLVYLLFSSRSGFNSLFSFFSQSDPLCSEPTPQIKGGKQEPNVD
jgi:hypothetical protein